MSKKKIMVGIIVGLLAVVLIAAIVFFLRMRQMMAGMGPVEQTYTHKNHGSGSSVVYMTTDISPEGLMAAYEALNWTPTGKAAVKLFTGEPPASNYFRPEPYQKSGAAGGWHDCGEQHRLWRLPLRDGYALSGSPGSRLHRYC